MTYQEAKEKSLTVEWVMDTCPSGEECWCRTIRGKEPIMYTDREVEDEYYIARAGELDKMTVEHIIKLQNNSLK